MKSKSIREALQFVADFPQPLTDEVLIMPVNEIVARTLFDIANNPDPKVRGSMTRANRARKLILDRMGGRRRPGTKPVTTRVSELEIIDLTGGALNAPAEDVQPADGGRHVTGIAL